MKASMFIVLIAVAIAAVCIGCVAIIWFSGFSREVMESARFYAVHPELGYADCLAAWLTGFAVLVISFLLVGATTLTPIVCIGTAFQVLTDQ